METVLQFSPAVRLSQVLLPSRGDIGNCTGQCWAILGYIQSFPAWESQPQCAEKCGLFALARHTAETDVEDLEEGVKADTERLGS